MSKLTKILAGVLAVQFVLFLFLYSRPGDTGAPLKSENLLSVDFTKVDHITIMDKEKKSVQLAKDKDGTWVLPDNMGFPASPEKIKDVIDKMAGFKRSWPMGKTSVSAKQFEVIDEKFERKIDFMTGDKKLSTLYLGTSPSFKKISARVDGETLVYGIDFNAYDAPVDSKLWIHKDYYKVASDKAKEIRFEFLTLKNDAGSFKLGDLSENEAMDASKVLNIVTNATNPPFEEILGKDPEYKQTGNPVLTYSVVLDQGETVDFRFAAMPEPAVAAAPVDPKAPKPDSPADYLSLKVSKYPYVFRVRKSRIEDLLNVKRTELVMDKKAANPGAQPTAAAKSSAPAPQ